MPNSPRKNCPTQTIAIYHLKSWTEVLKQIWNFEIISINKKVTACQTEVIFSFFDISSKLPGRILGTLRGPNKKIFFFLICMAMTYNILNFEPNRWPWLPKSVTLGMKPPEWLYCDQVFVSEANLQYPPVSQSVSPSVTFLKISCPDISS